MDLTVIHQPGHSKDGSEMAAGNNEVDKLGKMKRIFVIREVDNDIIGKIHDQMRHPCKFNGTNTKRL